MNVRVGAAAWVTVAFIACSSSSSSPTVGSGPGGGAPGGGDPPPATVTKTVGSAGGSVSAPGVALDIPPGALASDTPISIAVSADAIPSGYTGLSPLYVFSPDGTTFQKPATVTFTTSNGAHPIVVWSNATGGYDALATTASATGVSAPIEHFSRGFVAEAAVDAPTDAGSDGATPSDGGTTQGITATIDGVVTTFAVNTTVVLGTGTTTIRGDDNATTTHWTLQIVTTGIPQEACQLNGNPYMTYTHYMNGSVDALYSTKTSGGVCTIVVTHDPKAPLEHATGSFFGTVGVVSGPTAPGTHVFQSATYDVIVLPGA